MPLRDLLLAGVVLACCPCAWALNPALDVSQYAHTSWKIREGFSKGTISSIAQTPDGYLWLGSEFGLLRFDGVRAVPWQAPTGQQLPSNYILSLLVSRDGTLWIGTQKGLASWKDGKLTLYPELDGQAVVKVLEDRESIVWVGASGIPTGRLCAIRNGSVECHGDDGSLGRGVYGFYEDRKGNLWAGVINGLWRWKPGPPKFYALPCEPNGIHGMAEDDDGALLIGRRNGIQRFSDGETEVYPLPSAARQVYAIGLLRDRDGGLWIGTPDRGLVHVHERRTDVFAASDGLTSGFVSTLFEDREGTVWVVTRNGLDRFRDFAAATFSVNEGLSNPSVYAVLAGRDGSVWLGGRGGLDRWKKGQITPYDKREGKLDGEYPNSLFRDRRERIWVSTNREFGYLENERFIPIGDVPGGGVFGIAEDTGGSLWLANSDHGLLHLLKGRLVEQTPWAALGYKDLGMTLAADHLHGGLWMGFSHSGLAFYKDGQVRASYTVADGLGKGWVSSLRLDDDGTLWAATEGGLSRLKNGRVATLTSKNGLPCDAVHWSMEDDSNSLWLYMTCGLVRIARPQLDVWAAAVDKNKDKDTKREISVTVFDSSDGVGTHASPGGYGPKVAKTADGKLWFMPGDSVSVVDPRHLPFNKIAPPVHIEQITADHKTYDASSAANGRVPLPALIRDLEIDYTALSLVVPEKVRFRYKLEGWDRDWQDVGNRRQAFYTGLGPRRYRFRVTACNNDGVWNEAGTFLDFSVAPAYYQTAWFRLSCVAAFLALLWGLYQLRLRQLAREFNAGLEARVNERTRIARELHDTLLQSFHGILLRFQIVSNELPDGESKQKLDGAIDQAAKAIIEGRDAVQGLRSSTVEGNDLGVAIRTLGEELAAANGPSHAAAFRVQVEGTPRNLHPILRDEVYRIAGEGMRNAFRHADAQRIEVEIRYDERQLRVRVRDDGKGIAPKLLGDEGREGHYGLRGMRERAKLIGGKLTLWSELGSGTEVELNIPAARAYGLPPGPHRSWFAEKFSGKYSELKS